MATDTKSNTRNARSIARLFRVLGDHTRLKIMQLLLKQQNICVGEVADALQISTPATSQHLKQLELHGLLQPVRMGQRICYQPNRDNYDTDVIIKTIQLLEEGE